MRIARPHHCEIKTIKLKVRGLSALRSSFLSTPSALRFSAFRMVNGPERGLDSQRRDETVDREPLLGNSGMTLLSPRYS
jgi:hypothetical protein